MAGYLYLVQMDIPARLEAAFNRIYDTQHVPNLIQVPGVQSCTRYRLESADVNGVPKYAALYEVDSPDTPNTTVWKVASDKGDWVTQIRPHTTNRTHIIYRRIP
jgi:hypothetical protein